MAKKTHVKVRMVPEAKPDSPFFYYVKKPAGGEKAKIKLKAKNIKCHIEVLEMRPLYFSSLRVKSKDLVATK